MAETSPSEPPVRPRKRSSTLASGSAPTWRLAIGVAAVRPSSEAVVGFENAGTCTPERTQVFMNSGQLNRKARAARAGLTMFAPMPPNSCFTTTMAKKSPIRIVQNGSVTGQTKATRMPVTTAERSPVVLSFFMMRR